MVFYRKYRPQQIDDLDSASVRETLYAVLQKNIPHAFLFTGPKGLGKTSTARIVAKVVDCETPKNKREKGLEPCNKCNQCVSITNGNNVDILELDAASNRGIDEIRELKEKIRLAPVSAKRKVYIIDEVHMLTTEAFNALLKTLEEPPEHAMFILCTTEAHKVPQTIVSRCFQIQFKKATDEEIKRSLQRIIKEEKINIDDNVLRVISQISDGGFRDATKMLEELDLLANGEKITRKFMEEKYHITLLANSAWKLIGYLHEKRTEDSLKIIEQLAVEGADLKNFVNQVLLALHDLLLSNVKFRVEKVETNVGNGENIIELTNREIGNFYELFSKAYVEMKTAVLPQLPLELAVIEWCEDPQQPASAQNHAKQSTEPSKSYVAEDTEVSVSSLRKQVGTMKKIKALYGEKKKEPEVEVSIGTISVELMHTNGDGPATKEWMDLFWKNLIGEMKKYNHTVAGVLRGCTIKSYTDQQLIIQTAYKFHKERLDDMKNRDALLKIAKLLTGKDIAITVELRNS